jgi:membrane-associated protease RseP (regulator of RpoE activity)
MTALAYLLGVILFAVGVAVSIGLHEFGHLIPGKLFDVKVTQYFVGFGRTLWSRQIGETEYGLKAIPLGGYCKLVGMVAPGPDEDETKIRGRKTGMFAQLVDDARAAEYEHVDPADKNRLFYNKPWWQRVIIMGSGVAINIVLAFLLFAIAFMAIGIDVPTTTVSKVSDCVIAVTSTNLDQPARACTDKDPVAPAKKAGFKSGDKIVAINGRDITDWSQAQDAIRANGDKRASVVVVRDGQRVTLHPRTIVTALAGLDNPATITKAGFLGILPTTVQQRQDLGYVVSTMATGTKDTLTAIAHLPPKIYHVARAALGLEKRSADSPMSVVGAGRVAGDVASQSQTPLSSKFLGLLVLLGSLNLFLGLINLVPLPPFDGGGIATTLYDAARRGLARLLHRPEPGVVDVAKLLPVTYVMAGLILVVSVILIFADIVAPVSLNS